MRSSILPRCVLALAVAGLAGLSEGAQPPRPRTKSDVEAILAKAPAPTPGSSLRKLHIVLLAGPKDHGLYEHDYPLWQKRWKVLLGGKGPDDEPQVNLFGPPPSDIDDQTLAGAAHVSVTTAWQWPSREQLATADLIVMHSAPQWSPEHLDDFSAFLARGGGFVVVHMSLWQNSPELAEVIGLAKKQGTRFRHGPVTLELTAPDHPICLGLPPRIALVDESYFDFQGDASRIAVLAASRELLPGANRATPEPMFWTIERGKGRVFVCIAGHYDWTFDDPLLRMLLLRGMAWSAHEWPYRFDPLVLRGAAVADAAGQPAADVAPVAPVAPDAADPDLLVWLDASDPATLSRDADGRVAAWANKCKRVGHRLTSDGSQRPLYVADGLGGRGVIRFDGVDDVLRDTSFQHSALTWTVIMIVNPQSNRGAPFRAFFASNQTAGLDYRTGLNIDQGGGPTAEFSVLNVEGIKDAPGATNLRNQSSPFGQGQILVVRTTDQQTQLFLGGAPEGTRPANDQATSFEEVRVGARFYLKQERGYLHGDIAEVLLYQTDLSDRRLAAICAHLGEKYGLEIIRPISYTLEDALKALDSYDGLSDRRILNPIDAAISESHGDATALGDLEMRLAAVLRSDASRAGKDLVCRKLARIGTGRSVKTLGALLVDKELSHIARWALERIPDSAAVDSLREALPKTRGLTQAGIIASLGARRDKQAVPALIRLLADADRNVAAAAVTALGKIGTPQAARSLNEFSDACPTLLQPSLGAARLSAAARLLREGQAVLAAEIYRQFERHSDRSVRLAAFQGRIAAEPAEAIRLLLAALGSEDDRLRGVAAQAIRQRTDTETTRACAAAFVNLPTAGQTAILDAWSDRDDATVRRAALAALASPEATVRLAAQHALIASGRADDVPRLANLAVQGPTQAECDAALVALCRLRAPGVDARIVAHLATAESNVRVCLIRSLAVRQADQSVASLIAAAEHDSQAAVRVEAFKALEDLAAGEDAGALIELLFRAPSGDEQAAAQRAVVAACSRIVEPRQRAAPLLSAFHRGDQAARCTLLKALGTVGGNVGGDEVLQLVHAAMKDADAEVRDAGMVALAAWPDASVAQELLDVARQTTDDRYRVWALRGLARVVPRPGPLPRQDAFELLRQAMTLAKRPEQKRLIIQRMAPIRVPDCLAFVLSHIDDPSLRVEAIAAAASLAEGMKESHPQQARAGMQKLLRQEIDPALRKRLETLMSKMANQGN